MIFMNLKKLGPVVIGWLIFASGILNISSALWSYSRLRMRFLLRFIPLEVSYASRTTTILAGMLLIFLANGIWERKQRAWWLTILILAISFVSHIFKGLDFWESISLLIPIILLIVFKNEFRVRSGRIKTLVGIKNAILILLGLLAYLILGFYSLKPHTRQGHWFTNSISVVGIFSVLTAFGALFSPFLTKDEPTPEEREQALKIISKYGKNSQDYFKTTDDKQLFFQNEAFLAYKVSDGIAIVLGDPVAIDESEKNECVQKFEQKCILNGWQLVFLDIGSKSLIDFKKLGFKSLKIGEEAIVEVKNFSLEGNNASDLRYANRKISKQGFKFEYLKAPIDYALLKQAKNISDEWLKINKRKERVFIQGEFDYFYLRNCDMAIVKNTENKIIAFTNLVPVVHQAGIDLIRRSENCPNRVMEFLFINLILYLQQTGVDKLSLGMAPLANVSRPLKLLSHGLGWIFSFKGLLKFKSQFMPTWEPKYVVFKNSLSLAKLPLALNKIF